MPDGREAYHSVYTKGGALGCVIVGAYRSFRRSVRSVRVSWSVSVVAAISRTSNSIDRIRAIWEDVYGPVLRAVEGLSGSCSGQVLSDRESTCASQSRQYQHRRCFAG